MNIEQIIKERYSVRSYLREPINQGIQTAILTRLKSLREGPLGSSMRFSLLIATDQERSALRGLGTYGFIKNPTGFIVGAVKESEHALEDYGYAMEEIVLEATALGLGTCWLGGSFTQSSFARKIHKHENEIMPAVVSIGYATQGIREIDLLRRAARSETRRPWNALFFNGSFFEPLPISEVVGGYTRALEMVRLAPSASNKQPWRVVRDGNQWYFYCQRTPGFGIGSWYFTLLQLADLQRLDIGIAMCHFELTARDHGLQGKWVIANPGLKPIDENTVYIATWQEAE